MYDLTTEKEESITYDVIQFFGLYGKPVTPSMIQQLMNYCTNIPWSQLEDEVNAIMDTCKRCRPKNKIHAMPPEHYFICQYVMALA
jgi:hypothetical protein